LRDLDALLLDYPRRLGVVTRQQFRLVFGDLGELALEDCSDKGVKVDSASRLAQQCAVGRILCQSMLE